MKLNDVEVIERALRNGATLRGFRSGRGGED